MVLWHSLDHHGDSDVIVVRWILLLISVFLQDGVESVVTNDLSETLESNRLNLIELVGWCDLQSHGLDFIDWDINDLRVLVEIWGGGLSGVHQAVACWGTEVRFLGSVNWLGKGSSCVNLWFSKSSGVGSWSSEGSGSVNLWFSESSGVGSWGSEGRGGIGSWLGKGSSSVNLWFSKSGSINLWISKSGLVDWLSGYLDQTMSFFVGLLVLVVLLVFLMCCLNKIRY